MFGETDVEPCLVIVMNTEKPKEESLNNTVGSLAYNDPYCSEQTGRSKESFSEVLDGEMQAKIRLT
jgi:hypothetical protein